MSKIDFFDDILNPDFKVNSSSLEEQSANMSIELVKTNCRSIIFRFDKQLGREYKGGVFPFFDNRKAKVCKVCDFIIFAEINNILFALVIELKRGRQQTLPQIKAGENFVDFALATVNRVNDMNFTIQKRRISIREFQRKRKTKLKDIEYDHDNHHFFDQNKFRIISFLK
jgi:hypothetical protein